MKAFSRESFWKKISGRGLNPFWRWNSVNLAMSLPSVLAWVLYLIHWYKPPWYNKFVCACRFWSLVFMQGFSVESKTSGCWGYPKNLEYYPNTSESS
jgi:hypothetical protein